MTMQVTHIGRSTIQGRDNISQGLFFLPRYNQFVHVFDVDGLVDVLLRYDAPKMIRVE